MILKKSGFTLVEIMVTSAIIGMLVAVAVPNFMASRSMSVATACRANAKQLQTALEVASLAATTAIQVNNLSAGEIEEIVYPDYIKTMPRCSLGTYYTDRDGNVMCTVHYKSSSTITTAPTPGGGVIGAGQAVP